MALTLALQNVTKSISNVDEIVKLDDIFDYVPLSKKKNLSTWSKYFLVIFLSSICFKYVLTRKPAMDMGSNPLPTSCYRFIILAYWSSFNIQIYAYLIFLTGIDKISYEINNVIDGADINNILTDKLIYSLVLKEQNLCRIDFDIYRHLLFKKTGPGIIK